jgi:hypothetical protein
LSVCIFQGPDIYSAVDLNKTEECPQMEEVQPIDYQLGTAEYNSRCILCYMVLLHVLERFGTDLTRCGGSTAHGAEVWPHHIIISTLFVTAVFAVKM